MTSGATGVDSQVWEHVKYFYNAQAWLPKNMVFVNKRTWEALDDDTRAKIEAVAAEIEAEGWAQSEKLAEGYLKTLAENGMVVAPPGPKLAEGLKKVGETLTEDWLKDAGDEGKAIIDRYRQ